MATISKFEELEIWQLARLQTNDFDGLVLDTPLAKDYELRNQMNASSGSVMDNIAEGFERSGNLEFKNFLVIAKGSNGEYRSQLYRCLDRRHITQEKFEELYSRNIKLGNKILHLFTTCNILTTKGRAANQMPLPPNLKPRTSNIEQNN